MSDVPTFEHPDVVICPGGPMLLRGDHVVEDDDGRGAPHHPSGQRRVPVRQVGDAAVVRRHAQGAAGAAHAPDGRSNRATTPRS